MKEIILYGLAGIGACVAFLVLCGGLGFLIAVFTPHYAPAVRWGSGNTGNETPTNSRGREPGDWEDDAR